MMRSDPSFLAAPACGRAPANSGHVGAERLKRGNVGGAPDARRGNSGTARTAQCAEMLCYKRRTEVERGRSETIRQAAADRQAVAGVFIGHLLWTRGVAVVLLQRRSSGRDSYTAAARRSTPTDHPL